MFFYDFSSKSARGATFMLQRAFQEANRSASGPSHGAPKEVLHASEHYEEDENM